MISNSEFLGVLHSRCSGIGLRDGATRSALLTALGFITVGPVGNDCFEVAKGCVGIPQKPCAAVAAASRHELPPRCRSGLPADLGDSSSATSREPQ